MSACSHLCRQGRDCDCADMCRPLSATEAALIWLIVLACTGICLYLIVCFLTFLGV